ncbi:sigma-54 interaction domain-containing protein [Salinisphaera aquimarina]|uniref:HTH-type transcriptional regulatory protein TyrR n=1 Tax=Salinisphaera aquimarina TaxID=2094031 RepID=A0ABV7EP33_9GAMM
MSELVDVQEQSGESLRALVAADTALLDKLFETSREHLLIADGDGRILRATASCGAVYGLSAQALCATTVADLQARGVLSPSVTLKVLASRAPARVMQITPTGRQVMAEAYPVFVGGKLVRVISRSRDTTDLRHLREEYALLTRHLADRSDATSDEAGDDPALAAHSPAMRSVMTLLREVAGTDATVMLLGESGVGKTALARQVHRWSVRHAAPFVDINCGAIPESLFESEMFGSMPGAFSGAPPRGRAGLMEQAQGGTLLLDEVAELPLTVQTKLLKVLQDGRVTRLGGRESRQLDFRLIVATNRDLATRVETGDFRLDLYYRLNVVPVEVPPLRERREEIAAIVEQKMRQLNARHGETRVLDDGLWGHLMRHDWPGNIRELENFVERSWFVPADPIAKGPGVSLSEPAPDHNPVRLADALAATERACLARALAGATSTYEIADRVGVSQASVVRKLKKHGLTAPGRSR